MKKLCKMLLENEDIRDIPLEHVVKVLVVLFDIINSGECYYERENDYV